MRAKYGNKKTELDGILFDSRKEATRWAELKLMERAGLISSLERQFPYELIPAQYINGKLVERACNYVADFVYIENGEQVVEDVKSEATRKNKEYIIKRKLMLKVFGLRIKEV